jgi:hypothetical protein
MTMRRATKKRADGFTEFVDDEGKKWIQTSTEDLFSIKELNEIIDQIEKKEESGEEIVLARIDFQTVNKDYYQKVQELQEKLNKRTEILKRLAVESRQLISSKNRKLKELITYIKKLHMLLAYYNLRPEEIEKLALPAHIVQSAVPKPPSEKKTVLVEEEEIEYTPVEEILTDDEGNETGPLPV